MRPSVLIACMLALSACGGGTPDDPEEAVRAWARAINDRDWDRACELTEGARDDCEATTRRSIGDDRLRFDGPATNGGGTKPGEHHYSLSSDLGSYFVTAVPDGDGYRIRWEALVLG